MILVLKIFLTLFLLNKIFNNRVLRYCKALTFYA